ncbi:MAG: outer membrane beta-barrel protein [Cyclobacteriaceae bacterium]
MRSAIVAIFLSFFTLTSYSQETGCLQTLALANEEFNAGRFFGIPSLLKECLDRGFTAEQRVQAYYLLAQAYLILDDPIAAEDSYLKLLKADPEFVATPENDPIDLVYLSKKFTATPIFTPHFRAGGNVSLVRTIHKNNTEPYPVERNNKLRPGFQFGGAIEWNINDNISVGSGLMFAFKSFKIEKTGISLDDRQEIIERQTWFDVPLYVKYRDNAGKVRPYGYAGLSLNALVGSNVELRLENLSSSGSQVTTEGPDEKVGYKRMFLNRSLLVGGGVYYKVGRNFIFADLRYMAGLNNLVNVEENYYGEDGAFSQNGTRYRWVGDYYRLDNVSLSIGFVKPLYNPRKIKRVNTKKVMRDISKGENQ